MPTVVDHPPRTLSPALLCWAALGLWVGGCTAEMSSAEAPTRSQATPPAQTLGARAIYTYTPDPDAECLRAEPQPDWLSPELTLEAVLDSLGDALSSSYFYEWYDEPTGIAFETVEVERLPTPPDPMRIAVVNMVDPDRWAERGFFQGTTGGYMTQLMISATFMQVAPAPDEAPLLDGLVLLYNGERILPMDHTGLDQIQQPEDVELCSP